MKAIASDTLWQQKAACKEKYCRSSLHLIMGAALAGPRALSGGLLGDCCPAALPSDQRAIRPEAFVIWRL